MSLIVLLILQGSAIAKNPLGHDLGYRQSADERLRYRIDTWDQVLPGRFPEIGPENAPARREPTLKEQRALLDAFGSPQVQIYAKCGLDRRRRLTACDIQGLTPTSAGGREAAARFLGQFRIDRNIPNRDRKANRGAINVSISAVEFLRTAELCISPFFCGIPIPIP